MAMPNAAGQGPQSQAKGAPRVKGVTGVLRESLQNPTKSHTVINRAMGTEISIPIHGSNQALQFHAAMLQLCSEDLQSVGEDPAFEHVAKDVVT